MGYLEASKQIFYHIRRHKLRSFLAMFGIMWGTLSVILLLALGQGFTTSSKQNMKSFENQVLMFFPYQTTKSYRGMPKGQALHIKSADIINLPNHIKTIAAVSPVLASFTLPRQQSSIYISYGNSHVKANVDGVNNNYLDLSYANMKLKPGGRFFNVNDIQNTRHTIFLSNDLANLLFKTENPINKTVDLAGVPFTVIGETQANSHSSMGFTSNQTYIPYSTFISIWGNVDAYNFLAQPKTPDQANTAQAAIITYFANKLHFDPTDKTAFNIPDLSGYSKFFTWFFRITEFFLGFCGILTLAVGGIGVANIMFLIVSERTAEIGLKMALGAEDRDIIMQIMLEGIILVAMGAISGTVIAISIIGLMDILPLPPSIGKPIFSLSVGLSTGLVLLLVGIIASYFPAKRAAKMLPVEALAF